MRRELSPATSEGLNIASLRALPLRFRTEKMLSLESAAAEGAVATGCEAVEDDSASDMDAVKAPSMLPRLANAFSSLRDCKMNQNEVARYSKTKYNTMHLVQACSELGFVLQ